MTIPNPPAVLTNLLNQIGFSAMSTPSVDGISKLNPSTFQLTKKGTYLFQVSLVMAGASRAAVEIQVNGIPRDTQTSVISAGLPGIVIQHTFNFPFQVDVDGVNTVIFSAAAEDLPVPGPTCSVTATECAIFHWNNYY
jgi:hypothetical protein